MERAHWMRERGLNEWKITKTDPGRIMLLDEAGQLFRPNVPKATKDRIISPVDTGTFQLRKCGYVFVACTQQPNLTSIPIRHGFTFGIAHRQTRSVIVRSPNWSLTFLHSRSVSRDFATSHLEGNE